MFIPLSRPDMLASMSGGQRAPGLFGSVKLYAVGQGSLVVAEIYGLPKSETGFYGFHIHEGTGCGGPDFAETASHYNPDQKTHPSHAGDLPPLLSCHGAAFMAVRTDRFTPEEICGKTVVIHEMPDDFHTQPAGNAGKKIACGVITAY